MVNLKNSLTGITDLSQLIRLQQPLEILVTERNQEDNEKVLEYINEFLDVIDSELKVPRTYKEYSLGDTKPTFIRIKLAPRIEIVASRILEKEAMKCATLNQEELEFFQEELNFFVDLYFLLVTTLIDLASIRKEDMKKGHIFLELFDIVKANLKSMEKIEELEGLFAELEERKKSYPDKPHLQAEIEDLLKNLPRTSGDFLFYPSKPVSRYVNGDVLVKIDPNSDASSISLGNLPDGVDLNTQTGELFVSDITQLKAGSYNVVLNTEDTAGGRSTLKLNVPIGIAGIPKYVVAPRKVISAYLTEDVLAKPTTDNNTVTIAKAEWLTDAKNEIPKGVALDEATGIVTVADEDLLEIGVYQVSVLITNVQGGTSRHDFSLGFKQDKQSIYTLRPNKILSEFKQGDILATVSDEDGEIIAAQKNTLPNGMVINSTGEIAVGDATKLTPGMHAFNVLVQKPNAIESMKTVFLTLEPEVSGLSYDISGLQPIDDLKNGTVIAQLINANSLPISKVDIVRGELPEGTVLRSTGDLVVNDTTKLEVGNYDIRLAFYVDKNGTTSPPTVAVPPQWDVFEVSLLLTFEMDHDSAWHVEIPKDWDEYTNNEIIARLIDCDGYSEVIIDPNTPLTNGLWLNPNQGTIIVQDATLLLSGETVLKTKSIDVQGGITEHRLVITIEGGAASKDEDYIMLPLKPANNYVQDEIIGYPYNRSYPIIAARVTRGLLPMGIDINPVSGEMYVSDPEIMTGGIYGAIQLKITNASGLAKYHDVTIKFPESITFEVLVAQPRPISDYQVGSSIIAARVSGGSLQGIQMVGGELAPGLAINSGDGEIVINQTKNLVQGSYQMELYMVEFNGASQQEVIDYEIGVDPTGGGENGGPLPEVVWNLTTPISVSVAKPGTLLAQPSIQGHQIVSATSNDIPSMMVLDQNSGVIRIHSKNPVFAEIFTLNIQLNDELGRVYNEQIILTITDNTSEPTPSFSVTVSPPEDFHTIKNGDILSTFNPESGIQSAGVAGGKIPDGSRLDSTTGRVIVDDRMILNRSLTQAQIQLSSSASGASTTSKSSAPNTYDVAIENKPIPNFDILDEIKVFLLEMSERLLRFETESMSDPTIYDALLPTYEAIVLMSDRVTIILQDEEKTVRLRSGGFDSQFRTQYFSIIETASPLFSGKTEPAVFNAFLDLYNELFVSAVAVSIYRQQDISTSTKSPVAIMYNKMASDLSTLLKLGGDVKWIQQNAQMIQRYLSKSYPNLAKRFIVLTT